MPLVNICTLQHIQHKEDLSDFLDAAGTVVATVPGKTKTLLKYSLTLPQSGQSAPALGEILTYMSYIYDLHTHSKLSVSQMEELQLTKL